MSWIIAARRTAVAPAGGAFRRLAVHELAAPVIRACLADAGLGPGDVDEVILANALGAGGNPARLAALAAGLPDRVAGLTIDRQCAGGLDAVLLAKALVESGAARIVVAGGAESHSRRPLRFATDPDGGPPVAYDRPPFTPFPDRDPDMHAAADRLATERGLDRGRLDAWAVQSHAKALAARADLRAEIVPLEGLTDDAFARHLSLALATRARVLQGAITAANAAVSADAAAFVIVSREALGARPLRIVAGATRGAAPDAPGLAPVAALREVLADAPPGQVRMAEVMEAYAAQVIATIEAVGLDPACVNRQGGALARGHPIGASGAILAVRLFHDLQGGIGLAAIAAAGGIGTALLVSRQDGQIAHPT
ncbi:acetyl-CoA C-acyltransferase [bacterium]|nr:acetyl-CoA C-acyltransferase [bacterium]